ncbi:nucleotidyltransferase family protein [Paenibacillus psychroresistens]|uniref:Nucleotidyltransferase family protein n=1 Tax=Paenibacillus psychroresistens TaxID=1778678 RepID=A0A6B8RT02_9BACL|nr:nucleotidyltransferase family protein [Paenibacillus psychroresistens]QGQ99591.1 nucleotidyltransferase family protein [Paenibacillus psychroresistens]
MAITNEADIIQLVRKDSWMMDLLQTAQSLQLPDWWICAGFVRSKLWDVIHGYNERTPLPDIDLIYFDPTLIDEAVEKELENRLKLTHPHIPWSIKNEARMHSVNNLPPYISSVDAISKFPETATTLGLKLDEHNQIILAAPCGIYDVIHLELKPTAFFSATSERMAIYEKRLISKNWQAKWPLIR